MEDFNFIETLFQGKELPTFPIDEKVNNSNEWFVRIFSKEYGFYEEDLFGNDKLSDGYILMHFLTDKKVLIEPLKYKASKSNIVNGLLRDMLAQKTENVQTKNYSNGELLFAYAKQVVEDSTFFKDAYLGDQELQDITSKLEIKKQPEVTLPPFESADPICYKAAETFLEYFPEFNITNPPAYSTEDVKHLLCAHMFFDVVKDSRLKKKMADVFLNPKIDPEVKQIHNALVMWQDFVSYQSKLTKSIGGYE